MHGMRSQLSGNSKKKKQRLFSTISLVMYPAGAESQSWLVWKRHVSLLVVGF